MFFHLIGLIVVGYYLLYYIAQLFVDCDLYLAYKERFGKSIDTLQGKVVWIVGASSGIGEHLAYSLARAGCKLVLSARRESELLRVKERCLAVNKSLTADDVEVLLLDVLDTKTHSKAFEHVLNKFSRLDILVNNSGRTQRAFWADIELGVDHEMFEVNVFGLISLSRIALRYFMAQGKGHLAVTSSVAGLMGIPYSATYTATKHALHGYYDSLRIEALGKNIKTTIFCPGPVQTPFLAESFTGKTGEKLGEQTAVTPDKISSERCGELYALALANGIHECWVCFPKVMILLHICFYYPNLGKLVMMIIGPQYLLRLRDSKKVSKLE
ncbi:dehydrogenase/reductase SDR family member 7 [Athalia rosae]|uniref:dehydrogenase/reductase SDR family member 7 n=1 Tax=Athalia rosae TaxID=37344 RepID=UPI002034268C|nr:dehydrogenase/reductase SDR family member 7 [Athalia rosae]